MSVALLPCYENVGSGLGDERNHTQDFLAVQSAGLNDKGQFFSQ